MKTILATILMTLIFGTIVSAQAQNTQQAVVKINKQKKFSKSKMTVKVLSVEDSRCPEGVDCVWAGNAKVKIQVKNSKGKSQTFELNTNLDPKAVKVDNYEIKLGEVAPYPKANARIDANSYTAVIIITKL